jgi:hypothetical protein
MTVFLFFCSISLSAQEKIVLFFDLNKEVINEKISVDFSTWLETSGPVKF